MRELGEVEGVVVEQHFQDDKVDGRVCWSNHGTLGSRTLEVTLPENASGAIVTLSRSFWKCISQSVRSFDLAISVTNSPHHGRGALWTQHEVRLSLSGVLSTISRYQHLAPSMRHRQNIGTLSWGAREIHDEEILQFVSSIAEQTFPRENGLAFTIKHTMYWPDACEIATGEISAPIVKTCTQVPADLIISVWPWSSPEDAPPLPPEIASDQAFRDFAVEETGYDPVEEQ